MTRKNYFWLVLFLAFFIFLFLIRSILLPFVLGALTAYFLDPAAQRLEKMGLSRTMSTFVITACFFVMLILLMILIVPVLTSQISGLVAALPSYITLLQEKLVPLVSRWIGNVPLVDPEDIKDAVSNFSGVMVKFAGEFIAGIFQSGMAIVNLLSLILITPVVTVYLLEDWDRIIERIDSWLPRQHAQTIRTQVAIIDRTLAGFVRGQLNVCIILATYYSLGLSLGGLHFSSVIGIATGFLVIVPYAGWLLGTTVGLAVAFFQFDDMASVAFVAGVFLLGMLVEGNFLTPRLVGQQVGLHPVWIIFGMLSGAALFGFLGVLLSLPATAIIGVLIRFALQRYLASEYYQGTIVSKG